MYGQFIVNWERSWNIYYIAHILFLMTTLLDLVWFWVLGGHYANVLLGSAYESVLAATWDTYIPYQPPKHSPNTQTTINPYMKPTLAPNRVTQNWNPRNLRFFVNSTSLHFHDHIRKVKHHLCQLNKVWEKCRTSAVTCFGFSEFD